MLKRRLTFTLLPASVLVAAICAGCSKPVSPNTEAASSRPPAPQSMQNSGIEVEIVTPQVIDGAISATGKILVTEDRTASIGPVHEGRIVNLFAGQGSVVSKGQKLANLESADIDQAEADYL